MSSEKRDNVKTVKSTKQRIAKYRLDNKLDDTVDTLTHIMNRLEYLQHYEDVVEGGKVYLSDIISEVNNGNPVTAIKVKNILRRRERYIANN